MNNPGVPEFVEWIGDVLKQGDSAGFSSRTVSVAAFREMKEKLSVKGIKINKEYDIIEELWVERPLIPAAPVFNHDVVYTGLTAEEKLEKVRREMKKSGAGYYLISSLDDIAWLFNIRGDDVPYVSVTICHALVSTAEAFLFIDANKVSQEVMFMLNKNNVTVMEYEHMEMKLSSLPEGQGIASDPMRINCRLYDSINPGCRKIDIDEITTAIKAVKNETELANIKKCQICDGIAMVKFLIWIEENIGKMEITEITVAEKLEYFRRQQENNIGPSFNTIAGYKDHGAMMHYSANEDNRYVIENKGLMVVDSGGQYLSGTTDTTRTVVFAELTEEEKYDFTMVLKAHISLASAKFLYGATGSNLDVLARMPLWEVGLDYRCGTGHGVGYCLSVHEGPQRFSQVLNKVKLEKGMIITIEPGIYREGKHGVRTENMVEVIEDEKNEYGQFMRFEAITYCPVSLKGIDPSLLTDQEKKWLNNYHGMVYEKLAPYLDIREKAWLKENTHTI
jgi:Xaa-Pro aminopeptidase